jgi:hypothetical protein
MTGTTTGRRRRFLVRWLRDGSPKGMANREIHWIPGNHGLVGASKKGIHWDMSGDIE